MRVLYHPKVGALFVDRFQKDAPVLRKRIKSGRNWRAWFFGRVCIMIVKASPGWVSS